MPATDRATGFSAELRPYLRALGVQHKEVAINMGLEEITLSKKVNGHMGCDDIDKIEIGRAIERALARREGAR